MRWILVVVAVIAGNGGGLFAD
eukprot:COSAG05_NODE_5761_length_1094_cov_1.086432_1_plen_21_part_10